MDFILKTYQNLLSILKNHGFSFQSFQEFLEKSADRALILRHDVDRLPQNALKIAQIEKELGVQSIFYFRIVNYVFEPDLIRQISNFGHEIGYHYEDVSLVTDRLKASGSGQKGEKEKEVVDDAIESFVRNLEKLKKLVPVNSICMHGSPWSKWDSRLLWKYYDYRDLGIEAEPYFDLNFEKMLYLTDTGRRWNGGKFSIRDKGLGIRNPAFVKTSAGKEGFGDPYKNWVVKPKMGSLMRMTEKGIEFHNRYNFRSTNDIIRAAENGKLPDKMMMTFHPQRWTDKSVPWVKELVWQNVKNVGKYFLIMIRD